jgi:excisionase family DNA binding protein
MESIYTVEEVCKHLRVPQECVEKEIESGRLKAFEVAGLVRISEYALDEYKKVAIPQTNNNTGTKTHFSTRGPEWFKLQPAPKFIQHWPDGKVEEYQDVREGMATYNGNQYHLKVGWTFRTTGGEKRQRWLVIVDRYPTVEFVKCNNAGLGGAELAASIIKDRRGKQIPPLATLPPEYEQLHTGIYSDEVKGRGMPNGQAVICGVDDFETMVRHALIRYRYREERKKQKK